MSRTMLWMGSVLIAAAMGWAAAMYVQAGAPLDGAEDAYLRFGNALRTPDALERTETLVKLTRAAHTGNASGRNSSVSRRSLSSRNRRSSNLDGLLGKA